jgi:hypothetical protein
MRLVATTRQLQIRQQHDSIVSKGSWLTHLYKIFFILSVFALKRYDPVADCWTIVTSMKNGRDAMGVAFMGDRLFIVGGFDGQAYLNFVEAYDPLTNLWQQVKQ